MEQFEYYKEYTNTKDMLDRMNISGKQGWRCIGTLMYVWFKGQNHEKQAASSQIIETDKILLIFERKVT